MKMGKNQLPLLLLFVAVAGEIAVQAVGQCGDCLESDHQEGVPGKTPDVWFCGGCPNQQKVESPGDMYLEVFTTVLKGFSTELKETRGILPVDQVLSRSFGGKDLVMSGCLVKAAGKFQMTLQVVGHESGRDKWQSNRKEMERFISLTMPSFGPTDDVSFFKARNRDAMVVMEVTAPMTRENMRNIALEIACPRDVGCDVSRVSVSITAFCERGSKFFHFERQLLPYTAQDHATPDPRVQRFLKGVPLAVGWARRRMEDDRGTDMQDVFQTFVWGWYDTSGQQHKSKFYTTMQSLRPDHQFWNSLAVVVPKPPRPPGTAKSPQTAPAVYRGPS